MEYIKKLKALTKNLEKCDSVTKYSTPEEKQADTLAKSLLGIEESLYNFIIADSKYQDEQNEKEEIR